MTIFARFLLAIKVMAMFLLCSTGAWAGAPVQDQGAAMTSSKAGMQVPGVHVSSVAAKDDEGSGSGSGSGSDDDGDGSSDDGDGSGQG